jgi:enamine deaminase RidA (YjgF/YER057c/UK114 family)
VEDTFAPSRPPSTLLGVAVLGYPGQLVEIEAVAVASA